MLLNANRFLRQASHFVKRCAHDEQPTIYRSVAPLPLFCVTSIMYDYQEELRIWQHLSAKQQMHTLHTSNRPGTMTNSFLLVRKRRSLTSSAASIPSVKDCACEMNENTFWAMLSALLSSSAESFCVSSRDSALVRSSWELDNSARSPALCMIEPSARERIKVDWTPGFATRRERYSSVVDG